MQYATIAVDKIKITDSQPRQSFDEIALKQLASSMEEVGQLQPVIVQAYGEHYILIAGERRLRATRKNKGIEIAAVILEEDIEEDTLCQIQLVENLQREDLNPLERAISIKSFIERNKLTKKAASKRLGVARTTLTEWLNILEVGHRYQQAVIDEDSPLSLSHITLARALASKTGDPTKVKQLLEGALKYNLSRSETKEIIEIYHKYLHISMDEAIGAILLKRERQLVLNDKEKKITASNLVRKLLSSFNRISENLEEVMEEVGELEDDDRKNLVDEFMYIYQLMEILVPEFKDMKMGEVLEEIKKKNTAI